MRNNTKIEGKKKIAWRRDKVWLVITLVVANGYKSH